MQLLPAKSKQANVKREAVLFYHDHV